MPTTSNPWHEHKNIIVGWTAQKPLTRLNPLLTRGSVKVCNKDNSALAVRAGQSEQSSCDKNRAGNAYLCSDFAPRPMAEDWSYAFAVSNGGENCCKCFNLTWTDGPAAGKKVVLQVINEGGSVNTDGSARQFILLTPGGGVGPNTQGCTNQFGSSWWVPPYFPFFFLLFFFTSILFSSAGQRG